MSDHADGVRAVLCVSQYYFSFYAARSSLAVMDVLRRILIFSSLNDRGKENGIFGFSSSLDDERDSLSRILN